MPGGNGGNGMEIVPEAPEMLPRPNSDGRPTLGGPPPPPVFVPPLKLGRATPLVAAEIR